MLQFPPLLTAALPPAKEVASSYWRSMMKSPSASR